MTGRLSYAGIPYSKMQQGTERAPNPNELSVNVHLSTVQLRLVAPTSTQLTVQLPTGRLTTSTIQSDRTDTNVGDAEFGVRQTIPWLKTPRIELGVGLVLPTGPYVPRSGAANLPPEASFLTLGRGTSWGLVEALGSMSLSSTTSTYVQVSARKPFGDTEDGFSWGSEARAVWGGQMNLLRGISALAIAELQWRGGASEPDPFGGMRLQSANAGGTWWTLTPAISYAISTELSLLGGLRVPVHSNVRGNQLVPSVGGFVALSASWSKPAQVALPAEVVDDNATITPILGKITVVDYWATWCAPCKTIDSMLQNQESTWSDVEIIRVDASDWPDSGVQLPDGVTGLPAIEIFDATGTRTHLLEGSEALKVVEIVNTLREESDSKE